MIQKSSGGESGKRACAGPVFISDGTTTYAQRYERRLPNTPLNLRRERRRPVRISPSTAHRLARREALLFTDQSTVLLPRLLEDPIRYTHAISGARHAVAHQPQGIRRRFRRVLLHPPRLNTQSYTRPGAFPAVSLWGEARIPLRFDTSQESGESASIGAYYRQSMPQHGQTNAQRNVRRYVTGRYHKARPARCVPLDDVSEEDISRGSTFTGKPTPKAEAARREADRKHGERAYNSADALYIWNRLGAHRPMPPERPRNSFGGFDGDSTESAKRGRESAKKGVDISPAAAYNQWRPYVRHEKRGFGGCKPRNSV